MLARFRESLGSLDLANLLKHPMMHFIREGDSTRKAEPHVTRAEFMLWLLIKMQKLDKDDVEDVARIFDTLDADGSFINAPACKFHHSSFEPTGFELPHISSEFHLSVIKYLKSYNF